MKTIVDSARTAEGGFCEVEFHLAQLCVVHLCSTFDFEIAFDEFECDELLAEVPIAIRLEVESRFYEWLRRQQQRSCEIHTPQYDSRAWLLD